MIQNKFKSKVTKLLLKWGNNENDVAKMLDNNYEYAVKTYSQAKPASIADIISSLR